MIPASRILNKLDKYYRSDKVRRAYLEPFEQLVDTFISSLPPGTVKTQSNLTSCKILCLLKTMTELCNIPELAPTLSELRQQLESTALKDLDISEDWETYQTILCTVGLGMTHVEFSAFLFEEPEILAHYLSTSTGFSKNPLELLPVAENLAFMVLPALDNLQTFNNCIAIKFPEWRDLIELS
jgi:hypothetical protein